MSDGRFAHAWVRPHEIDEAQWLPLRRDVTHVLRAASARLERAWWWNRGAGELRGPDGLGLPNVSMERIALNGSAFRGETGDPFVLERRSRSGIVVSATEGGTGRAVHRCDTRGQPYDLAVCALLLTAQWHLGDAMRLGSAAGMHDGWRDAAGLVRECLGLRGQLVLTERGMLAWASAGERVRDTQVRNSA